MHSVVLKRLKIDWQRLRHDPMQVIVFLRVKNGAVKMETTDSPLVKPLTALMNTEREKEVVRTIVAWAESHPEQVVLKAADPGKTQRSIHVQFKFLDRTRNMLYVRARFNKNHKVEVRFKEMGEPFASNSALMDEFRRRVNLMPKAKFTEKDTQGAGRMTRGAGDDEALTISEIASRGSVAHTDQSA